MKGWNAGKWISPGDEYRESGRQPVYIPGWYVHLLRYAVLGGFVVAAIVVVVIGVLVLLGWRPR